MDHSPAFVALVNEAKGRIREMTIDELAERRLEGQPLRLIDVREDDEWRGGHIAGAEHIGKGVIERDIEKQVPDQNSPLILYCGGGFRSALAADALQKMGYREVYSLVGGWRAWLERRLPIEK